jgi:hypothetical protein
MINRFRSSSLDLILFCYDYQNKKDEIGGAERAYGRMRNAYHNSFGKHEGLVPAEEPIYGLENNIEM